MSVRNEPQSLLGPIDILAFRPDEHQALRPILSWTRGQGERSVPSAEIRRAAHPAAAHPHLGRLRRGLRRAVGVRRERRKLGPQVLLTAELRPGGTSPSRGPS